MSNTAPSAMPPAPVPVAPAAKTAPRLQAPTVLIFSDGLAELSATHPELKFRASLRDAPESARFRVAVDSLGTVHYSFLEQSSGDAALDEQARHYLALCRFTTSGNPASEDRLTWATATLDFGTDLEMPPSAAEHAP
jgi:hypothetical protein